MGFEQTVAALPLVYSTHSQTVASAVAEVATTTISTWRHKNNLKVGTAYGTFTMFTFVDVVLVLIMAKLTNGCRMKVEQAAEVASDRKLRDRIESLALHVSPENWPGNYAVACFRRDAKGGPLRLDLRPFYTTIEGALKARPDQRGQEKAVTEGVLVDVGAAMAEVYRNFRFRPAPVAQ